MSRLTIILLGWLGCVAHAENILQGTGAGESLTNGDQNILYGANAGSPITSGVKNTLMGADVAAQGIYRPHPSLPQLSYTDPQVTSYLTAIGHRAGKTHTKQEGVLLGYRAGELSILGTNTAIGANAGRHNVDGSNNTLLGYSAGHYMDSANGNVAVGTAALESGDRGLYNVAIGNESGTRIGHSIYTDEIANNFHGTFNTAFGNAAAADITSGIGNTCLGDNACTHTSVADLVTFVGFQAGYANNRTNDTSNANRNVAFGAYAGYINRLGEDNVYLGFAADNTDLLVDINTEKTYLSVDLNWHAWNPGLYNYPPAIGLSDSQITVVGVRSSVTENQGVSLGHSAKVRGVGAIALGANAVANHANAVAIGYGSATLQENSVVLGNSSTTEISAVTNGTANLGDSQRRFLDVLTARVDLIAPANSAAVVSLTANDGQTDAEKWQLASNTDSSFTVSNQTTGTQQAILTVANTHDVTLAGTLSLNSDRRLKQDIRSLDDALSLVMALDGKRYHWRPELMRDDEEQLGLIAQEVEKVLPELVSEDASGIKSVNYLGLVPVLVKAYQEQQKKIQQQDQRQAELTAKARKLLTTSGGQ